MVAREKKSKTRLTRNSDASLWFHVRMHLVIGVAAGGKAEDEEEEVKPVVPLSACLARLTREDTLPDYRSPATGVPGPATKHVRFGNFPRYMLVQLRR